MHLFSLSTRNEIVVQGRGRKEKKSVTTLEVRRAFSKQDIFTNIWMTEHIDKAEQRA
jgi:DNA-binding protein